MQATRRSFMRWFGSSTVAVAVPIAATALAKPKATSPELPDRFSPASYVDFRLERGWRFELKRYLDEDGDQIDTSYEEISPAGYWENEAAAWRCEHAIQMKQEAGPAWRRKVEEELAKRGYRPLEIPHMAGGW